MNDLEADLQRLQDLVTSSEGGVAVVAGPSGSGRRSFVESACRRAGNSVRLFALDLDGYEPDLPEAVPVLLAHREREQEDPFQEELLAILNRTEVDSSNGRLVVHVVDHVQLALPQRRWLIEEAAAGKLVLVLSCRPEDGNDAVVPNASDREQHVERFDVYPSEQDNYGPVRELLAGLDEHAQALERFLMLASICGRNVPIKLILAFLGLHEDEMDAVEDLVDDHLVEEEDLPLFEDLGLNHPSFPGLAIYRFRDLALARAIREELAPSQRADLATQLLGLLQRLQPLKSRGLAEVFIHLCEHMKSEEQRDYYLSELAWWVAPAEAETLTDNLVRLIETNALDAETPWMVLQGSRQRWPAPRRLALLKIFERLPDRLPKNRQGHFHLFHSEALADLRQHEESLVEARLAAEKIVAAGGEESHEHSAALTLSAHASLFLGDFTAARSSLERALEIDEAVLGPDHPQVANGLSDLAEAFLQLKEPDQALENLKRALAIQEKAAGGNHRRVGRTLVSLGKVLVGLERYVDARGYLERAVDILDGGQDSMELGLALIFLGRIQMEQGQLDEAQVHLERARNVWESDLGTDHPFLAMALRENGRLMAQNGLLEKAEAHVRQALDIFQATLGANHPETKQTLTVLEEIRG